MWSMYGKGVISKDTGGKESRETIEVSFPATNSSHQHQKRCGSTERGQGRLLSLRLDFRMDISTLCCWVWTVELIFISFSPLLSVSCLEWLKDWKDWFFFFLFHGGYVIQRTSPPHPNTRNQTANERVLLCCPHACVCDEVKVEYQHNKTNKIHW